MKQQTHYQADVLERFIPISLEMLVKDLLASKLLIAEQHIAFQHFCTHYIALFHAQSHTRLQHLKQLYQPYNPDKDTLISNNDGTSDQLAQLKKELYAILENANYERISENDLNKALNKTSPHGVKVSVDFEDFAEVALFYRGSAISTELHRNWKQFSLKKQPVDVLIYRRLFVLLQPKSRQQWLEYFTNIKKMSPEKAAKQASKALKNSRASNEENVVYLKLFKDIPRADLEMQFPNTRVQIRLFDKIKLGVMGGGGTAGGITATLTKFSVAIDPISAMIAVGGLLGVIWRQIASVFSQRAKYSATLTKNLYFYNLDNNMGALTHLIDSAESEECKEAILAYFFLLSSGENSRISLDKRIEDYIQAKYTIPMDFEIDDGLNKLQRSKLLSRYDNFINAVPLDEANIKLKQQWHNIFDNTTAVKKETNNV
ncbi:MAG: DUF3754 domain-containing protein [Methyloprofundus sp.]|nr:DUF3754 domain-containing protein [Methyloprofundus sp.]